MKLILVIFLLLLPGCAIWDGLRMANNPNNWDGQWDTDPANPTRQEHKAQ